jgi:RNA polymerase sigma factor (sigma-70 family)
MQEAMARAVRRGVETDAEAWLKLVARRIATDNARRAREIPTEVADLDSATNVRSASPEDIIVANESAGVIRKALNALPLRYRDALLTYAEDQDNAVVAQRFGISSNATWSLLCRARARLRQELDRVGYAAGVIGFRIQRWMGDLSTAGAVACMAIGVAIVAPATESIAAVAPAAPSRAVVSVTLPSNAPAPVARAVVSAPKPVVEKAKKAVAKVAEPVKVASYQVRACGANGEPLPLGVHVSILDDERKSVVASLVSRLPEQVRKIEAAPC